MFDSFVLTFVSVFCSFLLPSCILLYEYTIIYPFASCWMFGLFPVFGYSEYSCYEYI